MNRKTKILLVVAILCLGFILRIIYLDKGYNSDEMLQLQLAKLDLGQLIPRLKLEGGGYPYPPLSAVLLHFWIQLNSSEVWVRMYFVLFGMMTCLLLYIIGKDYVDINFGLVILFLSSISPLLIWSSNFIRCYMEAAFWIMLSNYFLLKIENSKLNFRNRFGYIFSTLLALYTAYLNIFNVIAQNMYYFIFNRKDFNKLKMWIKSQSLLWALFLPCVFLLKMQFETADAIKPLLLSKGFRVLGIQAGLHIRSIFATLGLDPALMFISPVTKEYSLPVLIAISLLVAIFTLFTFIFVLRLLLRRIKPSRKALFFVFLTLGYFLIYNLLIDILKFPLSAKYFVSAHCLALFLIAPLVYFQKKKIAIIMLLIISSIYLSRYSEAIQPEFATKKAYEFLSQDLREDSFIILIRKTNPYFDQELLDKAIIIDRYLIRDRHGRCIDISPEGKSILKNTLQNYKNIKFYKIYGNDELLGANALAIRFLKDNYFFETAKEKFRRIEIINYKSSRE